MLSAMTRWPAAGTRGIGEQTWSATMMPAQRTSGAVVMPESGRSHAGRQTQSPLFPSGGVSATGSHDRLRRPRQTVPGQVARLQLLRPERHVHGLEALVQLFGA